MSKTLFSMMVIGLLASHNSFAEDQLLNEARGIAQQLPPKLKALLEQEIADKGHVGAIAVCRDKAPIAAKKMAEESGWGIKRVSLKPRNSQRANADEWEQKMLTEFDAKVAAGEDPSKLEVIVHNEKEVRYMKALPVQPLCLSCHGTEEVTPEVLTALKNQYPNDQATGYRPGQIRGAISLRKSLP